MKSLPVGTKSLLFGVHQFILHPLAVLICWWRLYGRPKWWECICILVHDWGYWGCRSMDGNDGAGHPRLGGHIVTILLLTWPADAMIATEAYLLCVGHSRTFSRLINAPISRLCHADKLASALYPWWVYLPMARASGELAEYREQASDYHTRTGKGIAATATDRQWYAWMCRYMQVAAKGKDVSYGGRNRDA